MKKIGKAVYDVMKIEAKNRGMKLSAEQDLYKKIESLLLFSFLLLQWDLQRRNYIFHCGYRC